MSDDTTARLGLPLLAPGQAQKEMSHNEAITLLDLAVQASVVTVGALVPPPDPQPGQCWILGPEPGGAWGGHGGEVAGWTAGGWRFLPPHEGMRLWVADSGGLALHRGGAWRTGELHGHVFIEGSQVVGPRQPGIAEPAGGETVDAQARAAIAGVLEALRAHGLIASI